MPEQVSRSLVIDFEQGGNANGNNGGELLLVYDDREESDGGLNVRRQPLFTDNAYMLLYPFRASNIVVTVSAGNVTHNPAAVTQTLTETVTFDEDNESRVRRPVSRIVSTQWIGGNGGTISHEGSNLTIANAGNFVARLTYEAIYNVIEVRPPTLDPAANEEYTVNVVVTADEDL